MHILMAHLHSKLTCGGSASWSPCSSSSWLCSTGVAGSWTGETTCCLPQTLAAGPGTGLVGAACRRRSWCSATGPGVGTGWGLRGCGCESESRLGARCPWSPGCTLPRRAGDAVRSGRRAEHWWTGAWNCSSRSTRPAPALSDKETQIGKASKKKPNWR